MWSVLNCCCTRFQTGSRNRLKTNNDPRRRCKLLLGSRLMQLMIGEGGSRAPRASREVFSQTPSSVWGTTSSAWTESVLPVYTCTVYQLGVRYRENQTSASDGVRSERSLGWIWACELWRYRPGWWNRVIWTLLGCWWLFHEDTGETRREWGMRGTQQVWMGGCNIGIFCQ